MIPYVKIYTQNPVNFYDEYELTEDELSRLYDMFEKGEDQDATDIFIQRFILPPAAKYQDTITSYLEKIDFGIFDKTDSNNLSRNINYLTLGLIAVIKNNYSKYVKNVYGKSVLKRNKITFPDVKNSIINEVIENFIEHFQTALYNTNTFTINAMRTLQRELIAENYKLSKMDLSADTINTIIKNFKASLRTRYPAIYKAIQKKNIVVVSRMTPDGIKFMHYKLDYYIDMSVRATLLNVDRTSVQVMAIANDEPVVEYYLSDNRAVKKDREICQQILTNKIYGRSILAVDDNTAKRLGIMSIDEAKSTPDYAMGINCRHSIRRLDKAYLNQIDKLLQEAA